MNHICQRCSKEFHSPRRNAKFCSHECYGESLIGSHHSRKSIQCKQCKRFFQVMNHIERGFCSHECYSESLKGKRFHTKPQTEKICPNCGKFFQVPPSDIGKLCCSKECKDAFYEGKNHKSFEGYGELGLSYFNSIKNRASKKGKRRLPKEFSITIEQAWERFVEQNRRCSLTNLELTFGKNQTASLDRIDSSKGYIKGNIQWVHKDVNIMKNDLDSETFFLYCKLIVENKNLDSNKITK